MAAMERGAMGSKQRMLSSRLFVIDKARNKSIDISSLMQIDTVQNYKLDTDPQKFPCNISISSNGIDSLKDLFNTAGYKNAYWDKTKILYFFPQNIIASFPFRFTLKFEIIYKDGIRQESTFDGIKL